MRSYELMFVVDPRLSDDEASTIMDDYQKMIETSEARVVKTESWGRRKLAYEIDKLKEGRYFLFYILSENGSHNLAEVERRMQQNDKVLRYLAVRTDEDLERAGLPLPSAEEEKPAEQSTDDAEASASDKEE